MPRTLIFAALFCLLIIPVACIRRCYIDYYSFSFPKNSGKSYTDWSYDCVVSIWGPIPSQELRRIDVTVINRKHKFYLKDTFKMSGPQEFNACGIWNEFGLIKIVFYKGEAVRPSDIGKVTPDRIIREIVYLYDTNSGKFKRNF